MDRLRSESAANDTGDFAGALSARDGLDSMVDDDDRLDLAGPDRSQKKLSKALDKTSRRALVNASSNDPFFRAHLNLVSQPGAGAWLTALPEDESREWEDGLFDVALKRRCRVKIQEDNSVCPCCGSVMDPYADHALVCSCKGDRTLRHNRVRDVAFEDACEARMSPEREKPGLLLSRPHEEGIHCDSHGEARRPADVWLPRGMSSTCGRPEALDFAVTCGLTSDKVWKSAESPHVLFEDYCDFKRQYKDTGQLCSNQGLVFTPLVFEAHGGGFGPDVLRIFDAISKRLAFDAKREIP